jgi:predicted alpha/beta superfamily hydrolase
MRKFLLLFIFIFPIIAISQTSKDTIFSQKLKEDREFRISLPESYATNKTKKYPILLLLDGDYLFDPFHGTLTYGGYWDDIPEVIIVGISQNQKDERFTDCGVDPESGLPDSKGELFYEFIGQELMPFLEKSYRIAPFKIIAGHDVTAGYLNFFLYKDQPIFNAYISLSPQFPVAMEETIPDRFSALNQQLFYYQATAEGDIKSIKEKTIKLDAAVAELKKPNLNYHFDNFPNASHYSLVLYAIPNALYHIFGIYQPISVNEYNEKIAVLPSGYVDYLNKKYETIEKLLALKTRIRFNDFKAIEAAIIKNKAYDEFGELSNLAEKQYPKSMLANYELALMYEYTGDFQKARKYYQAAYEREEIGNLTQDMMFDKMEKMKNAKAPASTETPTETPTPEQKP